MFAPSRHFVFPHWFFHCKPFRSCRRLDLRLSARPAKMPFTSVEASARAGRRPSARPRGPPARRALPDRELQRGGRQRRARWPPLHQPRGASRARAPASPRSAVRNASGRPVFRWQDHRHRTRRRDSRDCHHEPAVRTLAVEIRSLEQVVLSGAPFPPPCTMSSSARLRS